MPRPTEVHRFFIASEHGFFLVEVSFIADELNDLRLCKVGEKACIALVADMCIDTVLGPVHLVATCREERAVEDFIDMVAQLMRESTLVAEEHSSL